MEEKKKRVANIALVTQQSNAEKFEQEGMRGWVFHLQSQSVGIATRDPVAARMMCEMWALTAEELEARAKGEDKVLDLVKPTLIVPR